MRAGAFTNDVRLVIDARAGGVCEMCGRCRIEQWHHRRARGMGSTKRPSTALPSNGLGLCAEDHHWVEVNRAEATRLGFLCRQSWEPRDVAVWIGGRFVLLTDDGRYDELPEEA